MKNLEELRQQINLVDEQLLKLIAERLRIVKQVGEIKKQENKSVRDPKREDEVIDNLAKKAESYKISKTIIKKIWKTFFQIAYTLEK